MLREAVPDKQAIYYWIVIMISDLSIYEFVIRKILISRIEFLVFTVWYIGYSLLQRIPSERIEYDILFGHDHLVECTMLCHRENWPDLLQKSLRSIGHFIHICWPGSSNKSWVSASFVLMLFSKDFVSLLWFS